MHGRKDWRKTEKGTVAALLPLSLLLGLITLVPSLDAIVSSFFITAGGFLDQGSRVFSGLGNYRYLFRDRAFFYSLNITIAWATLNVFFSLLASLLLAERLQRPKAQRRRRSKWRVLRYVQNLLKGKNLNPSLYNFLLIPLGIPIYIAVPLWRAFLHGDGGLSLFSRMTGITLNLLTDPTAAFLSALMVSVWMNIPLTTLVISSYMKRIGTELLDLASLETNSRFTVFRYIQYPLVHSSVVVMAVLNFIKACKEFTLIYLLTDGGVPLINGITEHYVIGSTTTLGVFLYNLFTGMNSYGLTASYAVMMAVIVIVVMGFWVLSRFTDDGKRIRMMKTYLIVLVLLHGIWGPQSPMGGSGLVTVIMCMGLLASFRLPRLFPIICAIFLGNVIIQVAAGGFLEGFSPLAPAVLFVLLQTVSIRDKKKRVLCTPHRSQWQKTVHEKIVRHTEGCADFLYRTASWTAMAFVVISSTIIVYYLVWLSISPINACYIGSLFPRGATFDAYRALFGTEQIMRYFGNTTILAMGTALLMPLVVIPAAWYFAGMEKRRADTIVSGINVVGTMGGIHSLIPLFSIFVTLGLINTFNGLIMIYTVHAIPYSLMTIKNFFEGYSKRLREATLLEGASTWQYLRWVLLPLSKPILKTTMILAFLGAWNGFTAPLLFMTDDMKYPVSLKLFSYVGSVASGNPKWNLFAAAAVINLMLIRLVGGRRFDRSQYI